MRTVVVFVFLAVALFNHMVEAQITLLNPNDALAGVTSTNTGASLLYSVAAGGFLHINDFTSNTGTVGNFAIYTQDQALADTTSFVRIIPVACQSCCTDGVGCSPTSTLIPNQPFTIRLAGANCMSDIKTSSQPCQAGPRVPYLNIQNGVSHTFANTNVNGYCDGFIDNNEVFQFLNYAGADQSFQIMANVQNGINGQVCVEATVASGVVTLKLQICNRQVPGQVFKLYGVNIPGPTTLLPLAAFLPGGSSVGQAVLYSVGQSGVVVNTAQTVLGLGGSASLYYIAPLATGLSNSAALMSFNMATCTTTDLYCTRQTTIVPGFLVAFSWPNINCATSGYFPYMNICNGLQSTVSGETLTSFCSPAIQNNDAFTLNIVQVAGSNLYQIQAWNTANGNLCVQTQNNVADIFQLHPCDASNVDQLFGFAAPTH